MARDLTVRRPDNPRWSNIESRRVPASWHRARPCLVRSRCKRRVLRQGGTRARGATLDCVRPSVRAGCRQSPRAPAFGAPRARLHRPELLPPPRVLRQVDRAWHPWGGCNLHDNVNLQDHDHDPDHHQDHDQDHVTSPIQVRPSPECSIIAGHRLAVRDGPERCRARRAVRCRMDHRRSQT